MAPTKMTQASVVHAASLAYEDRLVSVSDMDACLVLVESSCESMVVLVGHSEKVNMVRESCVDAQHQATFNSHTNSRPKTAALSESSWSSWLDVQRQGSICHAQVCAARAHAGLFASK